MNKDLFFQLVNNAQIATALLLIAIALWGIFFYLEKNNSKQTRQSPKANR